MSPRLAFACLIFAATAPVFAGEAEWKARLDAANAVRMSMTRMEDLPKSQAMYQALADEIEVALKEELKKGEGRAEIATAAYWLASTWLYLPDRKPNAAVLLKMAMEIRVKRFGPESAPVADVWEKVAWLPDDPDDALGAMRRALAIREKVFGGDSREVALTLSDIGYNRLGARRWDEAEAAFARSAAILEKAGPDSVDAGEALGRLGWVYVLQKKPEMAIPLYRRALAAAEKAEGGAPGERTAKALEDLAYAYAETKQYEDAEALLLRAIPLREKVNGPKSLHTIAAMGRLSDIYSVQNRIIDNWKLRRKLEAAQE